MPLVVSAPPLKLTFARKHSATYEGYNEKPFVMKKLINLRSMLFYYRLKCEVELYIGSYGKKKDILRNKWADFQDLLLQVQ